MITLDQVMKHKQATNEALAAVSGFSPQCINKVRLGRGGADFTKQCLWEALLANDFRYSKRGPKGPRKGLR